MLQDGARREQELISSLNEEGMEMSDQGEEL
jgi:hypothetical protein